MKLLILLIVFAVSGDMKPGSPTYREKTINRTLDMVLIVGSDLRAAGKHPTWGEMETEVAKRMRIKRVYRQ